MRQPHLISDVRSSLFSDRPATEEPRPNRRARRAKATAPHTPTERAALDAATCRFSAEHDRASFELLYCEVTIPLAAALRRVGLPADAVEDVTALTAAHVWAADEPFAGRSYRQFVAFTLAVARRKVAEWRRDEVSWQAGERRARESAMACWGAASIDDASSPEEVAMAREALAALTPIERDVLQWRAEDWTWEETAAKAGRTVAQVRAIHERAVQKLREE